MKLIVNNRTLHINKTVMRIAIFIVKIKNLDYKILYYILWNMSLILSVKRSTNFEIILAIHFDKIGSFDITECCSFNWLLAFLAIFYIH